MIEENILVNPDTLKEEKKTERKQRSSKDIIPKEEWKTKNIGGRVAIKFESNGRFNAPPVMYFTDFTVQNVTDLSLTNQENIYPTLLSSLNDIKNQDSNVMVEDLTTEELLEALIGIKLQFNKTKMHTHRWMCDCQIMVPDKDKKYSEAEIDLSTIKYRSIEQVDEDLKEKTKEIFDLMSDDDFKKYLYRRYADNPLENIEDWTREDELNSLCFKEPYFYVNEKEEIFGFRLLRAGDVVTVQDYIKKKYDPKIRGIKNKPPEHGVPLQTIQDQKEEEILKIKESEAKEALLFLQAIQLISYNGKSLTSHEERLQVFKKLYQTDKSELDEFLKDIQFGVYDERELICNLCGKPSKRWLQQDSIALEFLPLDTDTVDKHKRHSTGRIFIGV